MLPNFWSVQKFCKLFKNRKILQTCRNSVWDRLFSFHVCERLCGWGISNAELLVKLISPYLFPTVKKLQKLWDVSVSLLTHYTNHIKFKKKKKRERGSMSNTFHTAERK